MKLKMVITLSSLIINVGHFLLMTSHAWWSKTNAYKVNQNKAKHNTTPPPTQKIQLCSPAVSILMAMVWYLLQRSLVPREERTSGVHRAVPRTVLTKWQVQSWRTVMRTVWRVVNVPKVFSKMAWSVWKLHTVDVMKTESIIQYVFYCQMPIEILKSMHSSPQLVTFFEIFLMWLSGSEGTVCVNAFPNKICDLMVSS